MITFRDGPAEGQQIVLRRAPLMLRVVQKPDGKIDALDQLDDQPEPDETIAVYLRENEPMTAFLDWSEGGKRRGGVFLVATYHMAAIQPDSREDVETTEAWQAWARKNRRLV